MLLLLGTPECIDGKFYIIVPEGEYRECIDLLITSLIPRGNIPLYARTQERLDKVFPLGPDADYYLLPENENGI